jgi:2-polyprenyl-6-methoxyphenol hydroxylase-like FAD-dependent oxidoreductase
MADDVVLVVGGGIAGQSLGRALRQRGVPFVLAERSATAADGGLAINLPGNAVTALGALGLRDGLEKVGRPTGRREYRSAKGRLLFGIDEDDFWGAQARPRCVRRADLLALFADDADAVTHRRPSTVSSVRQEAAGVEVGFGDGGSETYGFVAGADGVHSTVRRAVFGDAGVREAVLSAASWRFMAPNPGVDCWTVWSGAEGAFLLIPVDGDEVYGYASATRGGPVAPDPAWLAETFGGYPDPVRQVIGGLRDNPAALYHSPVEEVRVSRWADGRCVLIGDAAHATAPVWAQGAALAMEDALALADLLGRGDWDRVGAFYEERRRERVAHVQAVTDRFSKVAGLPTWLRDTLLPVMGKVSYKAAYGSLRDPA